MLVYIITERMVPEGRQRPGYTTEFRVSLERYGGSDHDGRDVKYTDAHLKGLANMAELTAGLAQYSVFYNAERRHQALG